MNVPKIKLADYNLIPQVGLGLWQVTNEADFKSDLKAAVDYGYRHFDTAQAYRNEAMLGEAWTSVGLKREDLYITTKINVRHFTSGQLRSTFKESLAKLKTDYVDLLLLHFPVPVLRKKAWLELEQIKLNSQAKSIGVSNYTARHLEQLFSYANQKPALNQVEL